jgi:atypical dual specificity phosphatase
MRPGTAEPRGTLEAAPPPFARVAPALFLGNARAAGATDLLVRAGVTLCVNVSRQQPGPRAPGVAELRVPVFDDPAEDLLAHLEPTCAAIEAAARAGGACLVYCKNGRSRSAAICTAYLMRHRGLNLAHAFQVGTSGAGSLSTDLPVGRLLMVGRGPAAESAFRYGQTFRWGAGPPVGAGPPAERVAVGVLSADFGFWSPLVYRR